MTQNVQTGLRLWEGLANGCRASYLWVKLSRRVLRVARLLLFFVVLIVCFLVRTLRN